MTFLNKTHNLTISGWTLLNDTTNDETMDNEWKSNHVYYIPSNYNESSCSFHFKDQWLECQVNAIMPIDFSK